MNEVVKQFDFDQPNDMTDVIMNVSPMETPFLVSIEKARTSSLIHSWQSDAITNNHNRTALLHNFTQVTRKTVLTDTEDLAFALMKKGKELKRDIETDMLSHNEARNPTSEHCGLSRGLGSWLQTNRDHNNGTLRKFLPLHLNNMIDAIGKQTELMVPDMILVPLRLKPVIESFPGYSGGVYHYDNKEIPIHYDRFIRSTTDVMVLNTELFATAWFSPIELVDCLIAKDDQRLPGKMLICEWTLESRNEAGSGIILDLIP